MESLDLSVPRPVPGGDDSEFHVTRNFTYLTRVIRNVRRMNNVYARIKKKKEWGIDPDFVQLNPSFDAWMNGNPNNTSEVLPAWQLLKNIASNGPAILVLDHQGKSKDGQSREQTAVAGSSAKQRLHCEYSWSFA